MEVKRGWSTDFGKARYDVLIEEVDLLRMLTERGCDDPETVRLAMPTADVMRIMDAEAQAFMAHSLARQEENNPDAVAEHMAALKRHRAERDALLDKYVPGKAGQ